MNPYIKNARTAVTGYICTGALAGWSSRAVTVSVSYVSGGSAAGSRETTAATNYAGCLLGAGWASCDAKSIGATSTTYNYAGGLAGAVNGSGARRSTVNDSYAAGDVAVNTKSFVNAVGGLTGSANSSTGVTRSYATGNVNSAATTASYSKVSVAIDVDSAAAAVAGGLAGLAEGSLTAAYAAGNAASRRENSPAQVCGLLGALDGTTTVRASCCDTNTSRIADDADDLPPASLTGRRGAPRGGAAQPASPPPAYPLCAAFPSRPI